MGKKLTCAKKLSIAVFLAILCAMSTVHPERGWASASVPMMSITPGDKAQDPFLKLISLDLRDMDIIDVLKFIALKGKLNLAISKAISGRVTLTMKDVTIGDALDIILRANNLAFNRRDNIIYVMTGEEYLNLYGKKYNDRTEVRIVSLKYAKPSYALTALDSLKSSVGKVVIDEDTGSMVMIDTSDNLKRMMDTLNQMDRKIETHNYKLQYAVAKDIAAQLKTRLDAKAVGSIQADDRSNQLILTAFPERLSEVEKIIKELDVPTKAVLIDVRILQILLNPQSDYGINWSNPIPGENGNPANFNMPMSFPISTNISGAGTVGSIAYKSLNANALQAQLSALKQVTDTKVIARPRLMVTNNQEANIHIGDTIPYVTSTTTGTGDTATVSEQINFIDVGIKLKVTPSINDDGYVTMKIRPEISSRTKDVLTPQKASIPQVNTTFVETTAIVKDGNTVIIGGLKQLTNQYSKQGMPFLMDIPVAGYLFKNQSKNLQDTEIAIFLTPHIVDNSRDFVDEQGKPQPDKTYSHNEDASNAFSSKDDENRENFSKTKNRGA